MELRITTEIRGEPRTLLWSDGVLSGDEELLDRVQRCAEGLHVDLAEADTLELIRVCQHATPAPLEILSDVPTGRAGFSAGPGVVNLTEPSAQSLDDSFSAPA